MLYIYTVCKLIPSKYMFDVLNLSDELCKIICHEIVLPNAR